MSEPNEKLPFIGWHGCEEAFYLDALQITEEVAIAHWVLGKARFLPKAAERVKELIERRGFAPEK
jgi:hypothetical protein